MRKGVDSEIVPCANGGLGEEVNFSADFHMIAAVNFDAASGGHIESLTNSQNVSGVGAVTGDTYRVTSVDTGAINFPGGPLPLEVESQLVVNLIGRGSAVNFRVRVRFHLLITPNFDQPGGSRFLDSTVECD